MQRLVRICGALALLATATALLAQALLVPKGVSVATLGLGAGITLVGAVSTVVEQRNVFDGLGKRDRFRGGLDEPIVDRTAVLEALVVPLAAGLTYLLSVHAGLGPVVASALVGVAAGLGIPEVDTAAYCGSFVGMVSPAVFPAVDLVIAAGLVSGLAFVAASDVFAGFGGKLGTLALFGCASTGLLVGASYGPGSGLAWSSVALVVPAAVVGAVATVQLSVRYELGTVLGSGLVGLLAGVALPVVLPGIGELLATVVFCASFVGMTTPDRLGAVRVAVAGAVCGVVFVVVAPAFVGAGGKLGTTAFISCLTVFGGDRLSAKLSQCRQVAGGCS